jgi:hypothetical protein
MDSHLNQSVSTKQTGDNANLADKQSVALNDSDRTGSREDHLEDRIHQVLEQKLVSLLDEEGTNREIRWLRRQVNLSLGILVILIFALGGVSTWFAYRQQIGEQTTTQSGATSAIAPADLERLDQMETQIQSQLQTLGDRLPENLSDSLSMNQTQLQAVSQQLETLETRLNQNQEALTEIGTSIDELQQSLLLKDTTSPDPEGSERAPDSR